MRQRSRKVPIRGMPYLVASLNEKTGLHTQFVDTVAINDAAFFEAPIIFMEPIPGSMLRIKNANPWLQGQHAQGAQLYVERNATAT